MSNVERFARRPALAALLLVCGIAMSAQPVQAALAEWRIDPTHSRVIFNVNHAGFSYSLGVLSGPEGQIRFDPDGWDGAEVDVSLPMARLDFGDERWNRTMAGRRWFDVSNHPQARFRSTRIEPIDNDNARLHGELTVAGQTTAVVLELRRNAVKRHPLTLRRTAGFSATATLDRRDVGLDSSPRLIGNAVRVRIEVEATRQGRVRDDAADPVDTEDEAPSTAPIDPETDDADPQHD